MSEVCSEGKVTVYNYVCPKYSVWEMLLYKMICVFVIKGEGNISIYNDVCLRYRWSVILLCAMMCV